MSAVVSVAASGVLAPTLFRTASTFPSRVVQRSGFFAWRDGAASSQAVCRSSARAAACFWWRPRTRPRMSLLMVVTGARSAAVRGVAAGPGPARRWASGSHESSAAGVVAGGHAYDDACRDGSRGG